MIFGLFYGDWTLLLVLFSFILTIYAQWKVNSTFSRYSKVISGSGMTAAEAARKMLDANGLYNVEIRQISGNLTDHYDPRTRTLNLSETVCNAKSTAAIGVACHEAGHAVQHAENYAPLDFRMQLIPLCNIGSRIAMPLFIVGLFLSYVSYFSYYLMLAGIICYSLATLFQLVTLPVEFDASRRALAGIRDQNLLYDDEIPGSRKVLSAAALTYVAALATSLLYLLRLLIIARNSRR